jgi:cysteinyl-tRNA synthetase
MDDDFNSAGALGHLFDLVRVINQSRSSGAAHYDLLAAQELLIELSSVLGLQLDQPGSSSENADPFIELLIDLRNDLRGMKQWDLSDKIRDRLENLGVILEDSKQGTTWRWKS